MMPVSETHPLSMCTHFVVAVPMEGGCHGGGLCLQGYYSSKGLAVLGTVMDGDCGIDVACQMLCLPQTLAQRVALREEISDYLLARVNKPWMQEVMGLMQEVDLNDVRQILREPADAKWGDTAVAVAKRDTHPTAVAVAVEVADQDTAEAVALRRDAIKWVTKSKDLRFIANLGRHFASRSCGRASALVPGQQMRRSCAPRPSGNRGVSTLAEVEARSRTIV